MFRSVDTVLRAKSLAIVGASPRAPWPKDIFQALRDHHYPGRVHLINPRYTELWDQPCYPDFGALPDPVDHAAVIVSAPHVNAVIEDGVKHGLRSATVYAAGVGDGADPQSQERGERLRQVCAETGLVVCGPNCMGTHSWREKLFLYPNRRTADIPPGAVAVAFQSGGTLQFWVQSAGDRGVRFSYAVSTGNELSLDLADYIDFFVSDPNTKIIVLFIEGIRRPAAFMAAAAKALEAGKPIIAIKSGRSKASRDAAFSHTGAVAGDYSVYEAMCERYGIINCRSLDNMVETALAFQAGRLPKGNRVGFVTTSGGTVDLLLDFAEENGIQMPALSEQTVKALEPHMQDGIHPKNPLDAGIPAGLEQAKQMCEAMLRDPNLDMVAWAAQLPRAKGAWGDVSPIRSLLDINDKPFFGFGRMAYRTTADGILEQEAVGTTFLQGLESTLRALSALAFYAKRQGAAVPPLPAAKPEPSPLRDEALLTELSRYGIEAPRSRLVGTADEAIAAAEEIGFPVAVKTVSAELSHKTEFGGVRLNVRTPNEMKVTIAELESAFRSAASSTAALSGFLVQEMISGVEAIVGARMDEQYGPVLLIGSGGTTVELQRDIALHMLPVTADDIQASLGRLRLGALLRGYRGQPSADILAFVECAIGLGRFFLDYRQSLADIEINPLFVRASGRGACAADIRTLWH